MTDALWAVGDVHGCDTELHELLGLIGDEGRLVFLGDYVSRGPGSRQVLDTVMSLVESGRAVALLGNHDADFVTACKNRGLRGWDVLYGRTILSSFGVKTCSEVPTRYVEFLDRLPLEYEYDDFLFRHGALGALRGTKTVVCGHTTVLEVVWDDVVTCVDTGAPDGALSAVECYSHEVRSVACRGTRRGETA